MAVGASYIIQQLDKNVMPTWVALLGPVDQGLLRRAQRASGALGFSLGVTAAARVRAHPQSSLLCIAKQQEPRESEAMKYSDRPALLCCQLCWGNYSGGWIMEIKKKSVSVEVHFCTNLIWILFFHGKRKPCSISTSTHVCPSAVTCSSDVWAKHWTAPCSLIVSQRG